MRAAALTLSLLTMIPVTPLALPQGHGPHGGPHDATVRHPFDDAAKWAKVFDDPERDKWQKPEAVLDALGVKAGAWVADIGAATGYFAVRLARRVGPAGKVYGIDIEPTLVAHLRDRAMREKLPHLEALLAAPDDPRLPDNSVDLVLVVNTWHHIDTRLEYLDRLRRALRAGGRVAIVDYKAGDIPVGPPPEHRLSRESVVVEFAKAGWELAASPDVLPYQYVLSFVPKPPEADATP